MGLMLLVVMYNECTNVLKSKIVLLNKANTLKMVNRISSNNEY
jgi:hypothetical protein